MTALLYFVLFAAGWRSWWLIAAYAAGRSARVDLLLWIAGVWAYALLLTDRGC